MIPARRTVVWLCATACALLTLRATAAVPVGQPAPDLTLPLLKGGEIALAPLRGQVVMLNFWASWCGPCRQEFPLLDRMYAQRHEQGLTLLGIDVDAYPEDVAPFLAKNPVSFPILMDRDGMAAGRYALDAMPMTVLIDRQGVVRWVHRGYQAGEEQDIAAQIDRLLKET